MSSWDQYEQELPSAPTPILTSETEAHAKLKRNLAKALDRHNELLDLPLETAGDKRIVHDAATATIKAALATDKTALKARQDNTMARVLLRLLFYRRYRGLPLSDEHLAQLRNAPRKDLEAAMSARELAMYDRLEW